MAGKKHHDSDSAARNAGRTFLAISAVIVIGLLFSWAVSGPSPRQYPERIPVRFWHMWTANWKDVVEDICDRFNESQDTYEVIPLSIPGHAADSKFLLAVAGGDPPDCMAQWNQVIPKWAESGLILALDEMMTPEEWQDFLDTTYPIAKRIGMYKGKLYGLATGINIFACYYRPDFLEEAGMDPDDFPQTLEELTTWAEKLHRFDERDHLIRVGFMPQFLNTYVPVFGGSFYDYEEEKLTIITPASTRAAHFLADSRRKIGFEEFIRFESSQATTFGADWPFITGAYAIIVDGQWRVEQLKQYAPEIPYRTAPLPPPAGGSKHAGWASGNFMVIPRGAKQAEGAWAFIKFWSGLSDPEAAAELATWGGWLPLNNRVATAPKYREYLEQNPQFQTFLDVLPSTNILTTPPVPFQIYLNDRITRADESLSLGTFSPEATLKRLQKEVNDELARRQEFGYAE